MKSVLVFGIIALLASVSFLQITLALETEQEPEPPQIPEPSPAPEPIRLPDPSPAPNPFPEESDSEKVKRLIEANNNLKQQNNNLQNQISSLKNEKLGLQAEISELNNSLQNLKEIALEQIRVIMELVNQLKEIMFEKIFFTYNKTVRFFGIIYSISFNVFLIKTALFLIVTSLTPDSIENFFWLIFSPFIIHEMYNDAAACDTGCFPAVICSFSHRSSILNASRLVFSFRFMLFEIFEINDDVLY